MIAAHQGQAWGQIVAQAWKDESFKQKLLADPAAVLQEYGIAVLQGVQVKVVENSDTVIYLTLPTKPSKELCEADLNRVAGGIATIIATPTA
jgi:hypothetical protein